MKILSFLMLLSLCILSGCGPGYHSTKPSAFLFEIVDRSGNSLVTSVNDVVMIS
jgi:hypothetical protein